MAKTLKNTSGTRRSASRKAGGKKAERPSKISARNSALARGLIIFIITACVVFAAVWIYLSYGKDASDNGVVATVNGRDITREQLELQYGLLPQDYRASFTKEEVLEQIVDEEVVVQAAERSGIVVTPEDINNRVQKILADSGLTITELQENLEHYNVSQELFEQLIARQMLIERYINETITITPIDDATLQEAYTRNEANYRVGEQVTVRHVLLSSQRDDAALLAKRLYDEARAGADFCELAKNYSDDRGSRDTCGEYTFPRGFMVPEFEKASFEMEDGGYRLIQTQFGYHIIHRINMTSSYTIPFSDVRETLLSEAMTDQRATKYRELVDTLRGQATIKYADGRSIMPSSPPAAGLPDDAPAEQEEVLVPIEPAPETVEDVVEVPVEPAPVEEVAPVEEPAPTAGSAPAPSMDSDALFSCIGAKSKLYGATWESSTASAVEMFAKADVALNVVYCDKAKDVCDKAGVQAYPTWVIAGKTYLGAMSIDQLKNAAGC